MWREDLPRTDNPFRFYMFASRPHWLPAIFAVLFVIGAATLNALIPYFYKVIADSALSGTEGDYRALYQAVGLYVAISLGSVILWRGSGFVGAAWATGTRATARYALTHYITAHSHQYFSDRFSGSLMSKVKQAGDGAREFTEIMLWEFLRFATSVIAAVTITYLSSPYIAWLMLGLIAAALPYNLYFARKRIPYSIAAQDAETALNGATVDALTNISSVHEFANRGFEVNRLRGFILDRRTKGLRNWRYGEWTLLGSGFIQTAFMAAMMLAAVYLASEGLITPGDIILFLGMIWLLEDQLTFMAGKLNHFSEAWGQLSESLKDILIDQDVADTSHAGELALEHSGIAFDDVTFKYGGVSVFENLTFTIPQGQRVGLIGRSGAGKSTLVKLILRHYDVASGEIRIGHENIADVTKESLRSAIAVVPQEPALFHRSIHDNIAYSKPESTREEVIRAAELAQAHDFISELPDGYESLVGERGVKLSGGQRQRIAIARALLKDAPILLLDEATSALDSESEKLVQKALLALMEGRTVLAIAHRLSTLRAMDRLIVFDKGKIIEDGTHDELLKKGGLYADLWNHQAGGFLT